MNRANRPQQPRIPGSSYASRALSRAGDGSTLSLDFTTMGGVLDPRLTFSRASTATFINSQGYVEYAGANLFLQSENISSASWFDQNGATRAQVSITNPIGGATSTQVTSGSASNAISQGPTYQAGLPHVIRIWVRAGTSSQLQLGVFAGGFVTGTISVISGTATVSGTGLCLVTGLTATWTQLQIVYPSLTGSGAFLIYPDTASPVAGRTIYVWGAQLNPGSTAQTYYPTTTTAYHGPRFDYDPTALTPRGLLIEGAANNLAANSNLQAAWLGGSNTTVTANTSEVTSPDGTNNAAKVALTNAGYCSRFESITGLANATTYTFSYWIRGTAGNQQRVYSVTQGIDLVTQSNLTYTTTGWTRVQITFTSGAASNNVYIYVASRPTGTVNDVLYIYGCQLETGNGASSLIPTGASTGNRAADSCLMSGTNFSDWFTTAGTFLIEHQLTNAFGSADRAQVGLGQYSPGTSAFALFRTNATTVGAAVWGSGGTGYQEGTSVVSARTPIRSGMTLDFTGATRSLRAFANGTTGASLISTTGTISVDRMFIGSNGSGTSSTRDYQNGHIRSLKFWPSVLSNAQLQALTT